MSQLSENTKRQLNSIVDAIDEMEDKLNYYNLLRYLLLEYENNILVTHLKLETIVLIFYKECYLP